MKNIFSHSVIFAMIIVVVSLSIGMNISKMKCADNGQLYFGTQVPSCNIDNEIRCNQNEQLVSCCLVTLESQCCPETNDNNCASEIKSLKFDFETLLYNSLYHFYIDNIITCNTHVDAYLDNTKVLWFFYDIKPPPDINSSFLAQIQSFLL